jgi:hypothetical protein
MIELDRYKSLIIFSHPRSGSHWVQESICKASYPTFFNLREFFHPIVTYDINYNLKTVKGTIRPANKVILYSDDLTQRKQTYKQIQREYGNVCAKIHVEVAVKSDMLSFLLEEKSNSQYLLIERKNKMDVFWSDLIASTTKEWVNMSNQPVIEDIKKPSIEITKDIFERVVASINMFDKQSDILKNNFNIKNIYYEDLLSHPISEWWSPDNIFKIQNAKNKTTISNYQQVLDWLKESKI